MPRQQTPDRTQQQKGRNPGAFSPDDDEAQEGDLSSADAQQPGQGEQRQAQDDRRRRPEQNIEQAEDQGLEDAEDEADDEDESDDIATRP
jgi:hypothetical protein